MNIKQISEYAGYIDFEPPSFLEIQMFKAFFYKKLVVLEDSSAPHEYPMYDRQVTVEQVNDIFKITESVVYLASDTKKEEKIETVPVSKYFPVFNRVKNYLLRTGAQFDKISDKAISYLLFRKGKVPPNVDILFRKVILISKRYRISGLREEDIEKAFDVLKRFPSADALTKSIQIHIELNNPYAKLLPINATITNRIFRYEYANGHLYLTFYIFVDIKSERTRTRTIRDVIFESKVPLDTIKFNCEIPIQTVSLDNEIFLHYARIISNERVQRLDFEPSKKNNGAFINKIGLGKYAILPKDVAEKTEKCRYKPKYKNQFSLIIDTDNLIEKRTAYIIPERAVLNLKDIALSCYLNIIYVERQPCPRGKPLKFQDEQELGR